MDKKPLSVFLLVFVSGLAIVLTSAALLFVGAISSGVSAMFGIVGIGLIGASGSYFAAMAERESNRK